MDMAECEEIEYEASGWGYICEPTDERYTPQRPTSGARWRDGRAMRQPERTMKSWGAPLT